MNNTNNSHIVHSIPVGTLIELDTGVRLFVVSHSRDCDGTPLYSLCFNQNDNVQHIEGFGNLNWICGYSEEHLKVI